MTGVETAAALSAGTAAGGAAAAGLTAAQWAALAASAIGTGASIYGQQQQADDRREILNNQFEKTKQAEQASAKMVNKEGQAYQGDTRAAALGAQQQATLAQSQKDLGSAPTIIDGAGDAGAVSNDYLTAKADRALSEGTRLSAIAQEMAKTRGVGQLQQSEGLRRGDLAGSLQDLWQTNRNQTLAAQSDAESVQEPWWGQVGKIAAAAGSAYGMSGAGAVPAANGAQYGLAGASSGGAALGDFAGSTNALGAGTTAPSFWNTAGKAIRLRGG